MWINRLYKNGDTIFSFTMYHNPKTCQTKCKYIYINDHLVNQKYQPPTHLFDDLGVSKKIGVYTPKWMVYNTKPYKKMDDLGGKPTIFGDICSHGTTGAAARLRAGAIAGGACGCWWDGMGWDGSWWVVGFGDPTF